MQQRIVVKIGSSSLTRENGEINEEKIIYFARELVQLQKAGNEVLLVTSGSVAAGFKHIGYPERPKLLREKQASAAVGQALLMENYSEAFHQHGHKVAQILLTRENFSIRKQANNAMMTIEELLRRGILPIVNENDTVAVDELKFGDNDTLSALLANLTKAEQLIIFTDTDGLYTADPRVNPDATRINRVEKIDDKLFNIAGESGSQVGTGGMRSKIEAARIAVRGGVSVFIGKAVHEGDLLRAAQGSGEGTYFDTELSKLPIKKQWLAFHSVANGQINVDAGAERALVASGKSLLPAGVVAVQGEFLPGDVVEVLGPQNQIIGKGVVNYSNWQLQASAGLTTEEVKKRIEIQRLEVIHRDEWISL